MKELGIELENKGVQNYKLEQPPSPHSQKCAWEGVDVVRIILAVHHCSKPDSELGVGGKLENFKEVGVGYLHVPGWYQWTSSKQPYRHTPPLFGIGDS